jgi:hypothetical protein
MMISIDTLAQIGAAILLAILGLYGIWLGFKLPEWRAAKKKHNEDLMSNVINPLLQMYTRFDDEEGISVNTHYQNLEKRINNLDGWDNFNKHIDSHKYNLIKKAFAEMNAAIKDHNDRMPKLRDETLAFIERSIPPQKGMTFLPHGIFNGLYCSMIDGSQFSQLIHASISSVWNAEYMTMSHKSWVVAQSHIVQTADETNEERIRRVGQYIESAVQTDEILDRIRLLIEMRKTVNIKIKQIVQHLIPIHTYINEGGFIKGKCGVEKNM